MAALRRRTRFAAPLIISLAAGCSSKDDTPKQNGNPPGPDIDRQPPMNPPTPAPSKLTNQWDVRRVGPGECEAEWVINCPPNSKCNPPAPRASECPPGTSGKTVIRVGEVATGKCAIVPKGCADSSCVTVVAPCPLASGQKLPERFVEVWVVEKNKSGDGGCHAEEPEGTCPPGVDCNPPVPRKVACPAGISEGNDVRVALLKDKTCAIAPDGCTTPSCVGAKTACPE